MVQQVDEIIARFPKERGALIPILQKIQAEYRYLPEEALLRVAKALRVSESEIYGVATFYAQFRFVPQGETVVKVCQGTACHVRGGARILEAVERELGIGPGETTPDLKYGLETVACIGACALAPTMVINEEIQGKLVAKSVPEILNLQRVGK